MNVDTSQAITHASLCAGYGGIDLGLRRVLPALRTIAYAEREGFCCANLVSKAEAGLMDAAPIWTDVKTFPWAEFHGCVDILSGGYPCQPFSAAGKRLGAEDPRHLWPFISAGIALMRPSVCFFENVEGHISLGLPDVIEDLAGLGYRTTWCVASASEVGAPHQRKRVFILAERSGERGAAGLSRRISRQEGIAGVANDCGDQAMAECIKQRLEGRPAQPDDGGWLQCATGRSGGLVWPSRPGEQQFAWEPPRVVGISDELRSQGRHDTGSLQAMGISRAEPAGANGEHFSRQTQSPLGRDADGPANRLDDAELYTTCDNRTDELRLLGNGVVPATCERAFRVLVGELMEHQP